MPNNPKRISQASHNLGWWKEYLATTLPTGTRNLPAGEMALQGNINKCSATIICHDTLPDFAPTIILAGALLWPRKYF